MIQLSTLSQKISRKGKKRLGRGNSAGKGTYAGRGLKGQKSRSGGKHAGGHAGKKFPLFIQQLPKRHGMKSLQNDFAVVNLKDLESSAEEALVTPKILYKKGRISSNTARVKILGQGKLVKKLEVRAHAFSKTAETAILTAGGKVVRLGKLGKS